MFYIENIMQYIYIYAQVPVFPGKFQISKLY